MSSSIPRQISDLFGTALTKFRIGGLGGLLWKVVSGGFVARNAADSADAPVTGSQLNASGNAIVINSDAAGSGADWKLNLQRAATGMTGDVTLVLPPNEGSPNQVMQTDGSGNLSFVTPSAGSSNGVLQDDTALAFGASSPVTMFTKPAGSKVNLIRVYVDTAFNGTTPQLSIGISGTTSKYMGTGDIDLTTIGIYEVDPGIDVTVGSEALIATYSGGSSSAGAARIETFYGTPT